MTTTKSDCGCVGSTERTRTTSPAAVRTTRAPEATARRPAGPAGSAAAVETRPVTSAADGAGSALEPAQFFGGFRGLNPVDGLFLRADHLRLIQDYARSLTTALATACGPGVVHGLGVDLVGPELEVSPGLAISPRGRLLLLTGTVRIPLADLPAPPADGFWRVEVHWASGTSGSAPVYGSLCHDSCADGGASIAPWLDEGVELRLVPDSLPGLDAVALERRRNWLASAYFERERSSGQPWVVPVGPGSPVSLWSHDWADPTELPGEAGVSLALVQRVGAGAGSNEVDVWAARRMVDTAVSGSTWRQRLGQRPWSIYLAQILQFEAELTGVTLLEPNAAPAADVSLASYYQDTAKDLLSETRRFFEAVKTTDPVRSRGYFQRLEEAVQKVSDSPLAGAPLQSLAAQSGISELPPGGYLNVHSTPDTLEGDLVAFFGPSVDLRLRRLRADQVPDELLAAQSRDRIPLEPAPGRRPQVDILVPAEPADLDALITAAYGWIAFVRRGPEVDVDQVPPTPTKETEDVEVFLLFADEWQRFATEFTEQDLKRAHETPIGTLTFPKDDWAYPGGEVAAKTLELVADSKAVALIALTRGQDRPLAATRAGLFGTSLDSGGPLPVFAYPDKPIDAIVVIAQIILN